MALEDRHSSQNAYKPPIQQSGYKGLCPNKVVDVSERHQTTKNYNSELDSSELANLQRNFFLRIATDKKIKLEQDRNDAVSDFDQTTDHVGSSSMDRLPPLHTISFSIKNILSDRFGKRKEINREKKSSHSIFRPFEISASSAVQKSAFKRLTQEVVDRNHTVAASTPLERISYLKCITQTAYPRISEEIFNSKRKQKSSFSNVQMPPLGSLCRTVSQIGQSSSNSGFPNAPSALSLESSASSTSASAACRIPPPSPHPVCRESEMESSDDTRSECSNTKDDAGQLWPAWVYCTRYSDRPSSGPRYRRIKEPKAKTEATDEKRPRTAFSSEQLARLKREFNENRYLTEKRRQQLSADLGLNEAQIKIWFQNKRAKIKKTSGTKNALALQLMAQGLYNHSTVPLTKEEEELEMRMNGQL